MPCVIFHGDERAVLVPKGMNVLQAAQGNKIPHYSECGGRGKCTTCRVKVFSGIENLMARNDLEMKQAQSRNWNSHIRLACQSRIMGDVGLERLVKNQFQVQEAYLETYYHSDPIEKEVTMLSVHIMGFDRDWKNQTKEVVAVFNQVLSMIQESILVAGGSPETSRGNTVLGYFGLISDDNLLENAIRASFLIQSLFQKKVSNWKEILNSEIGLHIGLDKERCLIGSFGASGKKEIKVLGKIISRLNKLMRICPKINSSSLVTEEVYQKTKHILKYHKKLKLQNRNGGEEFLAYEPKEYLIEDELFFIAESYFLIKDKMSDFAKNFYGNLFKKNPNFMEIFQGDMSRQYKMLTASLHTLVYGISRWEEISPMVRELGRRHRYYGTEPKDFIAFQDSLIITLEEMIAGYWDKKKEQAWKKIMDKLSQKMIEGYTEDF